MMNETDTRYILAGVCFIVGLYFSMDVWVLLTFLSGVVLPSKHIYEVVQNVGIPFVGQDGNKRR